MTLNEIRTRINVLVEKHTNKVRKFKNCATFLTPKVEFFNKGRKAGWAKYNSHTVGFNELIARDNWEEFENTIIHEIAHLATIRLFPYAKQHHGPEFRRVMHHMGGSGATYHNYDVSSVTTKQKRYVYACDCDTHALSGLKHARVKKGVVYHCKKCKATVKFTGKTTG